MSPTNQQLVIDGARLVLQLIILGIVGGAVTWFYSRLQKNRDLRRDLLKELASLHGRFIALRYRFNSFYVEWSGSRSPDNHPLKEDERRLQRWKHYEEACSLIGEFQALRPLLSAQYPDLSDDFNFIYQKYQDWRRRIGAGRPILQELDAKSEDAFHELRDRYGKLASDIRKRL